MTNLEKHFFFVHCAIYYARNRIMIPRSHPSNNKGGSMGPTQGLLDSCASRCTPDKARRG